MSISPRYPWFQGSAFVGNIETDDAYRNGRGHFNGGQEHQTDIAVDIH